MNGEFFQVHGSKSAFSPSLPLFQLLPDANLWRKFSNNASEMKKLAARGFENLLQVPIAT